MRDVTISKHGKTYAITVWEDRDNPTDAELYPEGAEKTMYTVIPHDLVENLRWKTADSVAELFTMITKR